MQQIVMQRITIRIPMLATIQPVVNPINSQHARFSCPVTAFPFSLFIKLQSSMLMPGGMPYRGAGGRSKKGGFKPDKPAFDERTRKIFGPLFPLLHSPLVPEPVLSAVEAFLPFRNRVPTAPHRYLFAGSFVQMHTNTRSNL
jgi:hypothetical protein